MLHADADIWASLPMPAVLVDASGCICALNPAAQDFLNVSQRAAHGCVIWQRLNTVPALEEGFERAYAQQMPLFVNEIEVMSGQGHLTPCAIQAAPVQDRAGGMMIMLITPRDLSGHGGGPRALAQSATQSVIGMAQMLAHEIKNPLAGITGAAQLLEMNLNAQDGQLTDLIVHECRRIVSLLDRVEQFGNLVPPRLRAINLHDVMDRARRSALLGFGAHMRIEQDYDPSLPFAHVDADQLLQVMLNLLKNASEAAPAHGGTIRLRSYFDHSYRIRTSAGAVRALPLQIEVMDDGPGVPQEIQEHIFDAFVSGKDNGTGLGLALVSKIITDHQGWISVKSQPGCTVFRISLPRAPAPGTLAQQKD